MKEFEADQNSGNSRSSPSDESPFFGFAKPYFDFIGKGKIYSIIYVVMAVINLLLPLGVIFVVIQLGFLQYSGARIVVSFILSWLIIAFASWIGFQLWWYRKSSLKKIESADFIATPIISEILQTFGEWLGTLIAIIGAGVGIIAAIFLRESSDFLSREYGIAFMDYSPLMIILAPVIGFIIIIIFRFIAEQIRILASIANSTKEIASKIKK